MNNSRTRILLVTTSYPLDAQSYSGIFVKRLVDHLPDGLRVTVLTPDSDRQANSPETGKADIYRFRYAPRALQILAQSPGGIPVALKSNILNYLLLIPFLIALILSTFKLGRRHDLIHANWSISGLIGGMAGKFFNKPVIVTLRGDDITRAEHSFLYRCILKYCVKHLDGTICVSDDMGNGVRREFPDHENKISVINNGVEKTLLESPRKYEDSDILTIISVGSLIHRKGYDITLKALALVMEQIKFGFTCVGEGPERRLLEGIVERTGLRDRVRFIGEVPPDKVAAELIRADLFILSSRSEGRPNVLVEAMACGLPVIGSNINGVHELIEHGDNGFLFDSENAEQLAVLISKLASDRVLREKTGSTARLTVKKRNLTWENTAHEYALAYSRVLGENKT